MSPEIVWDQKAKQWVVSLGHEAVPCRSYDQAAEIVRRLGRGESWYSILSDDEVSPKPNAVWTVPELTDQQRVRAQDLDREGQEGHQAAPGDFQFPVPTTRFNDFMWRLNPWIALVFLIGSLAAFGYIVYRTADVSNQIDALPKEMRR